MRRVVGILLALVALLSSAAAEAHPRATSLSAWTFDETARGPEASVTVRVPWAALQRVLPEIAGVVPERVAQIGFAAAAVDAYLVEHVRLRTDAGPCILRGAVQPVPSADATHFGRRFRLRCDPGTPTLEVDLFQEVDPSHLHLARAILPDGRDLDRVIVLGQNLWTPGATDEPEHGASSVADYFWLGVEHIAGGIDHLVFVLALLLTGTGIAQLATVVTGFTVAHSLTLALGVLGWVTPLPVAVEALIGFSIVVVAFENFAVTLGARMAQRLWFALLALVVLSIAGALAGFVGLPPLALVGVGLFSLCYLALSARSDRVETLRWFAALAFGLIHGFGFAGVLADSGCRPRTSCPRCSASTSASRRGSWWSSRSVGSCCAASSWRPRRGATWRFNGARRPCSRRASIGSSPERSPAPRLRCAPDGPRHAASECRRAHRLRRGRLLRA